MAVKNICHCPKPPGGVVECSQDQMALCIVEDGEKRHVCQDIVRDESDLARLNRVLSAITGVIREPDDFVYDSEIKILRDGRYNEADYLRVTFSLPNAVVKSLNNIDRNRGTLLA